MLFAAERITFLRRHLFKRRWYPTSSTRAGDLRFLNYIDICNLIWDVFFRYGEFDYFKDELFKKKVSVVYYWYENIKEEFKEQFFSKMKGDYQSIKEDDDFCRYMYSNLNEWQRTIFSSVLKSATREEFDLYMKNYDLEVENRHLSELLNKPILKLIKSKFR